MSQHTRALKKFVKANKVPLIIAATATATLVALKISEPRKPFVTNRDGSITVSKEALEANDILVVGPQLKQKFQEDPTGHALFDSKQNTYALYIANP